MLLSGNSQLSFSYFLQADARFSTRIPSLKIKYPAANNGGFDPRGSRRLSMQAWLPGSLPAQIKKSLFPSYPEKRTSVCYPCYHLHSQPAHTVCLFEYDCPVSGLQSGQHQRYSSQDNGCFPSQPTLLTIWVRNSGMYSGKYLLRLSSAGCFL